MRRGQNERRTVESYYTDGENEGTDEESQNKGNSWLHKEESHTHTPFPPNPASQREGKEERGQAELFGLFCVSPLKPVKNK